jgi:hypothetical protein
LNREGLTLLQNILDVGQRSTGRDFALSSLARLGPLGLRSVVPPPAPVPAPPGALLFHRKLLHGTLDDHFRARRFGGDRLLGGLVFRLLVLVGLQQIRGVEKGALFLADVDERRLNTGKHRFDPAQIDVAHAPAVVGAIHQQLHQAVVFQDRHAGLPLAPVDQDFTLQVRPQPPLELNKKRALRRACPPPNEEHAARARCWGVIV